MSEFQQLIDALNNHSDALREFMAHAGGKPGAATKPAAAATKPAATASKPAASKPAKATKTLTKDDLIKQFTEYMKVGDKDIRAQRVANVAAINEYFAVARISEVDDEQIPEALHYLDLYKQDRVPTFSGLDDVGEDAEDAGSEGGSLV